MVKLVLNNSFISYTLCYKRLKIVTLCKYLFNNNNVKGIKYYVKNKC